MFFKPPLMASFTGGYDLISTMVCFMMVKRMTYTSHPRKAAKQPLRKVVASVVVNAYTQ